LFSDKRMKRVAKRGDLGRQHCVCKQAPSRVLFCMCKVCRCLQTFVGVCIPGTSRHCKREKGPQESGHVWPARPFRRASIWSVVPRRPFRPKFKWSRMVRRAFQAKFQVVTYGKRGLLGFSRTGGPCVEGLFAFPGAGAAFRRTFGHRLCERHAASAPLGALYNRWPRRRELWAHPGRGSVGCFALQAELPWSEVPCLSIRSTSRAGPYGRDGRNWGRDAAEDLADLGRSQ
jgi:hypothetical protein